MKLEWKKNEERGLITIDFVDSSGEKCSVQTSSSMDPSIWLGLDNAKPMKLVPGEGWKEVNIDKDAFINARMHLTVEQVKALMPILHYFVTNRKMPDESSMEAIKALKQTASRNPYDDRDEVFDHDHDDFELDDDDIDMEDYKKFQSAPDLSDFNKQITRGVVHHDEPERAEGSSERVFVVKDALVHRLRVLDPATLTEQDLEDLKAMHECLDRINRRHGTIDKDARLRSNYNVSVSTDPGIRPKN